MLVPSSILTRLEVGTMAEQSYNYGYGRGGGGGSRRGGNRGDFGFWVLALIFLFALPPVGILMIVLKLAGGGKKKSRAQGRHPYYIQQEQGRVGARTVQMGGEEPKNAVAQPQISSKLSKMATKAKRLTVAGAALSAVFGFVALNTMASYLWVLPDLAWYLEGIVPPLCFFGAGLGCLWAGLRRKKQVRSYRTYLAMIGTKNAVSVSSLASALGTSPAKVQDALEDMLDEGFFPMGYLDYGSGQLVLSGGVSDPPPQKEEPEAEKPEEDPQNAVLEEIRAINAGIDNPKLNQQIDRIGAITAKVFEYQRSHPQKSAQLHSFLSYYLPTTLKILRAYAQLEDQEVEGENISAAMERIEGMMDKVVEGFEKQLDQLFQGDALDITADVEVLERMLAKDGLSTSDSLRMGH